MTAKPPARDATVDAFIEKVRARLAANRPVHRVLPSGGRIHIDRQLPFLVVYRKPAGRDDRDTDQLVKGEASHLTGTGGPRQKDELARLVDAVVSLLSESFGAVLLVELWTGEEEPEPDDTSARFRIHRARGDKLASTANVFEAALSEVKVKGEFAEVDEVIGAVPKPRGMAPLLSATRAKQLNCHVMGLEVRPVFRDASSDDAYPLVTRVLHRGVSRAIQKAVFEFTRKRTSHRPRHYRALGRRSFVKALWDVDAELADISSSFDFVLQVTPVNVEEAWVGFRRHRFEALPEFVSRPLRFDPAITKRRLFNVPLERIEDPTLAALLRDQQGEIDRKLTMLADRGTPKFLYGSLQVYGGVDDSLLATAFDILHRLPPRSRDESLAGAIGAAEFAARAEQELAYYREQFPGMTSTVSIRSDIAALTVSAGNLLVPSHARIPNSRVEALLAHEIGTHALTYANGRAQKFKQLYVGLPGYDEMQEGMAVLAEYLAGGLSRPRLRLLAARVVATRRLIEGASFVDVFRELDRAHGFSRRTAFSVTMRVFRGGGLTKDAAYLRGLVAVCDHLRTGGDFERLLVGKFGRDHIPLIEELRWRKMIAETPLRPRYLDSPAGRERLDLVRNGATVMDLVKSRKGPTP